MVDLIQDCTLAYSEDKIAPFLKMRIRDYVFSTAMSNTNIKLGELRRNIFLPLLRSLFGRCILKSVRIVAAFGTSKWVCSWGASFTAGSRQHLTASFEVHLVLFPSNWI